MRAIVALVGMMLVALTGTARAEVDCSQAATFTPDDLKECFAKWGEGAAFPGAFDAKKVVSEYSVKELHELKGIGELKERLENKAAALRKEANEAANSAKQDHTKQPAATEADNRAVAAESDAKQATTILAAVTKQRGLGERVFLSNQCTDLLIYCIDRKGESYSHLEEYPTLLPGDSFSLVVISHDSNDSKDLILKARNVRRSLVLVQPPPVQPPKDRSVQPAAVARLEITVATDALRVEVTLNRPKDNFTKILRFPIEGRQHLVEFGLMLPFAYQREVTPQGAVKYGMEPDLAFTITVFPGARSSSEPWQSRKQSWFGLMAGADLTNQVSDKRYYLGLDFSPVSGLALNAGLAILPWEYVPNPEQVPDVLTGDIEPDQRYRASFFFGARMTPEVFDTVKAAYQSLQGQ